MTDEAINPEVRKTIADMSGERIQERSTLDFPRHFWSAYKKGHYRFALAGAGYLGLIGGAIGLAVCAVTGFSLPLIAAFVGISALMGVEGFGATGSAAASRASGLAEKHARILDADAEGKGMLSATDDKLMYNGRGHHYEFPVGRDKGKFFSLKSGLTGSAMGAASGAVLGVAALTAGSALKIEAVTAVSTAVAHAPLLAPLVSATTTGLTWLGMTAATPAILAAGGLAAAAGLVVAGALTFGLLGLYFGLERRVTKSIFNQTDANINGNATFKNGPDLGRLQSRESDSDLAQHRLRRQAEIDRLENEYNDRITWGALNGRFRGFPGVAVGVLAGAALGAAAVMLTSATALVAPIIMAAFIAGGGLIAMNVFCETGTEAGAEATARAIDNEFERNRAMRAQGITPPQPREPQSPWLIPKAAITGGLLGAALGAAIASVVGVGVLGLLTVPVTASAIGISALIGGLTGATYGLGNKTLKTTVSPLLRIYDKVNSEHGQTEIAPVQQAALQAPMCEKITAEEVARLNEMTAAGNGKSFTQTLAQQKAVPQSLTVGA
jgi:hypothetical protein